ncbi:MAG: hypothetical protein AB2A00_09455 [Myxococcota bacterium]
MVTAAQPRTAKTPSARTRANVAPGAGMGTHMVAAVMLVSAVLFLAWVRVAALHLGYELGKLRHEQDVLVQERNALEVEIGFLKSPARLRDLAVNKLGMVPAQAAATVRAPSSSEEKR